MKLSLFAAIQDLKSCLQPLLFFQLLIKFPFLEFELPVIERPTNKKTSITSFKNYRLHDFKLIF